MQPVVQNQGEQHKGDHEARQHDAPPFSALRRVDGRQSGDRDRQQDGHQPQCGGQARRPVDARHHHSGEDEVEQVGDANHQPVNGLTFDLYVHVFASLRFSHQTECSTARGSVHRPGGRFAHWTDG